MTGSFWNVDNPLKPWGPFDPDAKLDIPFDWSAWLTDKSATYSTHTILFPDGVLEAVSSSQSGGVVTVLVKVADDETAVVGTKYPITCRITATAGGLELIEDQTVYLKIREK